MSARVSAYVCVCWTCASLSTSWQVELIKNLAIPLVSLDLDKLQSCQSGRASVRERREQCGRDSGSLKLNRCTYKLSRIRHVVRLRLTMCVSVTIYACVCVCLRVLYKMLSATDVPSCWNWGTLLRHFHKLAHTQAHPWTHSGPNCMCIAWNEYLLNSLFH